jgi:hypothetical protein
MWAEICKCAAIRPLPCGQGTASSFYRPRGGGLQSCRMALMLDMAVWCTLVELMVVLENLASSGCRGKSCACPGAASRVATRELLVWSPSVRQLESWLMEDWRLHSGGRGGVPSSRARTAPEMTLQRQGWGHSGGMATQGRK